MKKETIYIPIWDDEIILIYGNQQEVTDYIENKHTGIDVSQYAGDQGNYFKVIDNNRNKNYHYLVIYEQYTNHTVYHESLHVSWAILDSRGVEVSYNNQEPLAYLMDYISNEVLIQLNEWKDG